MSRFYSVGEVLQRWVSRQGIAWPYEPLSADRLHVLGIKLHEQAELLLDGQPVHTLTNKELAQRLGHLAQTFANLDQNVWAVFLDEIVTRLRV